MWICCYVSFILLPYNSKLNPTLLLQNETLKMKYFLTKSNFIQPLFHVTTCLPLHACFLNPPILALTLPDKVTSPNQFSKHRWTPSRPYRYRHMINTSFPLQSKHIYKWSTCTYDQSWLINWLKQFFTARLLQGRCLKQCAVCINHKSDQSDDCSSDSRCYCTASAWPNVISLPRNA